MAKIAGTIACYGFLMFVAYKSLILLFVVIKHATTAVLATVCVAGVSENCTYAKGTKVGRSAKRLTQRKRNWKGGAQAT